MTDERSSRGGYKLWSRVLAKKGGAEPLPSTGNPLIISADKHRTQTDDEHLADAVIDATLDVLVEQPRGGRARQGAAPLTDLLDPALLRSARRKKKFFRP